MPTSPPPNLSLTAEERARFNHSVTIVGLNPAAAWGNTINITASGDIPANMVTQVPVDSIQQLNAMVGVPQTIFQDPTMAAVAIRPAALAVPATLQDSSPEAILATLGYEEHKDLRRSAEAHVFSFAAAASANLDLVNASMFPLTVDVIAAQSLTLADGVVLSLSGAYVILIVGSLSIGTGAQISSTANTVVNAQVAFSAND